VLELWSRQPRVVNEWYTILSSHVATKPLGEEKWMLFDDIAPIGGMSSTSAPASSAAPPRAGHHVRQQSSAVRLDRSRLHGGETAHAKKLVAGGGGGGTGTDGLLPSPRLPHEEQEELRAGQEALETMRRGTPFTCYTGTGDQQTSRSIMVWYEEDESIFGSVYWCDTITGQSLPSPSTRSTSIMRRIRFHLLSDIYVGMQTQVFQSGNAKNCQDERCLSLLSAEERHALDLEAESSIAVEHWVTGLKHVLVSSGKGVVVSKQDDDDDDDVVPPLPSSNAAPTTTTTAPITATTTPVVATTPTPAATPLAPITTTGGTPSSSAPHTPVSSQPMVVNVPSVVLLDETSGARATISNRAGGSGATKVDTTSVTPSTTTSSTSTPSTVQTESKEPKSASATTSPPVSTSTPTIVPAASTTSSSGPPAAVVVVPTIPDDAKSMAYRRLLTTGAVMKKHKHGRGSNRLIWVTPLLGIHLFLVSLTDYVMHVVTVGLVVI
jgi:hypothetical protein